MQASVDILSMSHGGFPLRQNKFQSTTTPISWPEVLQTAALLRVFQQEILPDQGLIAAHWQLLRMFS